MKEALTYDDVLLIPQYSDIESRKEIDISNNLDNKITLKLPIIASPMDTVTELDMAIALGKFGGLGVVHRYNTIEKQCAIVRKVWENTKNVAAAIGVTADFKDRARALIDAGVNILCVDVAHGHHILVERAIKVLKDMFGEQIHIMAGNVATLEAFNDLADWGANSVRCNIGGGSICSTRIQTGHGLPGLETIFECAKTDRETKIIADGGIRNSGDMVKAFAAGADFIMVGSLLAATHEAPGELVESQEGEYYKVYRGMASKEAQLRWKGEYRSNEGISIQIPHKGSVHTILKDIENGIRSGLSYSGCRSLAELHTKARFTRQTNASLYESHTHIVNQRYEKKKQ